MRRAIALLALAAGCSPGPARDAASPSPSPSPVVTSSYPAQTSIPYSCPPATRGPRGWPAGVPAGFPWPPAARVTSSKQEGRVVTVRGDYDATLRDALTFWLPALREAGYEVGRGSATGTEADVPFTGDSLRGLLRLFSDGGCDGAFLLAIARP